MTYHDDDIADADFRAADEQVTALFAAARPAAGFEDRMIARLRASREPRFRLPRPIRLHPAVQKSAAAVAAAIVLAGIGYAVSDVFRDRPPTLASSNLRHIGQATLLYSMDNRGPTWDAAGSKDRPVSGESLNWGDQVQQNLNLRFQQQVEGAGLIKNGTGTLNLSGANTYAGYAVVTDGSKPAAGDRGDSFGTSRFSAGQQSQAQKTDDKPIDTRSFYFSSGDASNAPAATDGTAGAVVTLGKPVTVLGAGVQPSGSEGKSVSSDRENYWFKPGQLGQQVAELEVSQNEMDAKRVPAPVAVAVAPALVPAQEEPKAAESRDAGGRRSVGDLEDQPAAAAKEPANTAAGVHVAVGNVAQGAPAATQAAQRRVIRNGQMAFEVDRFDSAFAQVSKLTGEAGGYVGNTSSQKLPNGKVQGVVTVRVPPDRMDTLVLQLRGIGDLKSQSLEAEDVSKKYTDLESELRAARAMEERLIAIIKEGKGQIKDLLAAEKELGVWRTKAEQLTGEMKYYDNLVSMATLNLTLTERDIQTPATAQESENVDAGIEAEDVEAARTAALKAIEEAKGRVVQSDLKRFDAGQFGATIVAEVPPDNAGPLLDRLKQLGKVARLDVQRKQTADANQTSTATRSPVRVEKRDTRFNLSIYNLANVAPRQTVTLNLAADDVEAAYRAIIDRVDKAGGRVVSSNLNRQKPEQTTGTISFEIPTPQADAVTSDLRAGGEPMRLTVAENPDVQNVTTAKRGYNVSIVAAASIAPRETATVQLAAADVAAAREKILTAANTRGVRILASQLNENDRQNVSATLDLDVRRGEALAAVEKAIAGAGQTIKRSVQRATDGENTLDSKIRLTLTLAPADKLPPRETTTMTIELADVEAAMGSLQASAVDAGGRVGESKLTRDREGRGVGRVSVDVPMDKVSAVVSGARDRGTLRAIDASKDLQVPPGQLARARVDVTFVTADTLVAPERGLLASIRGGLATSLTGLMWSLQLIVVGVCFVLPWAAVIYAIWRVVKRRKQAPVTVASPAAS